MQDEDAMYPYFKNPMHIRSIKSLHDDNSVGSSPQTDKRMICRSGSGKKEQSHGPGKLIENSAGRARTSAKKAKN